jgi:hypothetical protein
MPWLLRCNWWFLWPWKFLCQAVLHTERKIYIAERLFYFPKRSKSSWIEPHLAYLIILWNGKGTMVSFPWLHISSSWQENRTFYPDKFMKFKNPSDYKKPIHLSDIAFCLPTLISQFWKPPPWTSTSCTCYDDKIKDLIHAPTIKNKKKTNNFMEQNITELVSNMTKFILSPD